MNFEVTERENVFQGKIFDIQKIHVRMPDNHQSVFDMLIHPGAVVILPVDEQGRILFISQLRIGTGGMLLELPAGTLEAGEDPAVCAQRELREETGMAARKTSRLGSFFLAPGYSTEFLHIYLANDLYASPLSADDDEFLTLEPIPVDEAYALAREGKIQDGKTLAVMLMAQQHLLGTEH